jgi:3D (Asp-Asp-Asp) domain-containing protein
VDPFCGRIKRTVDGFTQLFLLWLLLFSGFCVQNMSQGAQTTTNATSELQGQCKVRTTAYTCSGHRTGKNANGSQLKAGDLNSAAADWSRFPLGTKFNICGTRQTYVVDDYGPALVGTNTIDLYMPSPREMHHWGVRKVTIYIIEPGSYERSLALLKPRKHVPYVRRMVKVLQRKV